MYTTPRDKTQIMRLPAQKPLGSTTWGVWSHHMRGDRRLLGAPETIHTLVRAASREYILDNGDFFRRKADGQRVVGAGNVGMEVTLCVHYNIAPRRSPIKLQGSVDAKFLVRNQPYDGAWQAVEALVHETRGSPQGITAFPQQHRSHVLIVTVLTPSPAGSCPRVRVPG
eukprot:707266-Prymnesium_polylepis.2